MVPERMAPGQMVQDSWLETHGPESKPMSGAEVNKMDDDARLLPVVEPVGKEFLVDIENREFIDTSHANGGISMHSPKGRALVNEMAGLEWRCFRVWPGKQDGMEV